VFAVPFDEIAGIVNRTPAATRQLASRARRRVRAEAPSPDADVAVQRRVVDAFLAATRAGDFEALLRILSPDVVFRADSGGAGPLARPPIVGAQAVADELVHRGRAFAPLARPAMVNGAPGTILSAPGFPLVVGSFAVSGGRIAAIDLIADPAKLRGVSIAEVDAGSGR
jgi:RNA polymerase sigma-70 factor (ECF subfamily)